MRYKILVGSAVSLLVSLAAFSTKAAIIPPPLPTVPQQCKDDNWRVYGDLFKTQGDCVSWVVTDGRNLPDGPPIH
jgi:hypothetical protein